MTKYKVGDEVLVKGVINDIYVGEKKPYAVKSVDNNFCRDTARVIYIREEDIIPVPDMTADEAWEIARKIEIMRSDVLLEIFDMNSSYCILQDFLPQQAKAKIEAWEAEKEIKVGDEVEFNGEIGVVTKIDGAEGFYSLLFKNGETGAYQAKRIKKTGRHIDIDGLLKKIGGDE